MFFNNQQHQIERAIAAFLSLFNNVIIMKKVGEHDYEPLVVDFRYAPTDKFKAIGEEKVIDEKIDPKYMTHQTNPRMSAELNNISLNHEHNLNQRGYIQFTHNNSQNAQKNGIPIILNFSLYARTANQKDAFAIMEQILPFFTPHITLNIKTDIFPFPIESVVTLTDVSFEDSYEGDFSDVREVITTFSFDMTYTLFIKGKADYETTGKPCLVDIGPAMGDFVPVIEKVITNLYTVEINFMDEKEIDERITVTPEPEHPFAKENITSYKTDIE